MQKASSPMRGRHGFTLVELLVVIALLAVLMALLMPALRSGIRVTRQSVCASNLKQVHQSLYALALSKQHGRLPARYWGNSLSGFAPFGNLGNYHGHKWGTTREELEEHGMTMDVGHCPGIDNEMWTMRQGFWWYWPGWTDNGGGTDYVYVGGNGDHNMYPRSHGSPYLHPHGYFVSLDIIQDKQWNPTAPSSVIYMSDISYNENSSAALNTYGVSDPSNHRDERVSSKTGLTGYPWQARGSNRLHADGHVAWYNLPQKHRMRGRRAGGHWVNDYTGTFW